MARERQFYSYLLGRVVLRTALVVAIVVFGFLAVEDRVVRWDLTEDQRCSLSPSSHRIAGSLEDPLVIRAYFSEAPDRYQPMQRQVFDILEEYEAYGKGKIKVERHDPLESRAAESEADSYGVQPVQLPIYGATQRSFIVAYGSIVLVCGDRASEVINIAERYPEGYNGLAGLEPDLTGRIWMLTHDRPKIGLTGYLEREAQGHPMMGMQQPRPEFAGFRAKLSATFDIEDVDLDRAEIDPKQIPLLLIVRPKEFSDVALFRLDQYVMKGGRVLLFVTQGTIEQSPYSPGFSYHPFKTGLDGWLENLGVRVPNEFVLHYANAFKVDVSMGVRDTVIGKVEEIGQVPNWFWPYFGAEGSLDRDNPATQPLRGTHLWWPHPVEILEHKLGGRHATALVRSHAEESWRWKDLSRVDRTSLKEERDGPAASEFVSSNVVVALEGTFTSYFADRPVPPSLAGKPAEKPEEGEKPTDGAPAEGGPGNGDGAAAKPEEGTAPPAEGAKEPAATGPVVVKQSETPTLVVVVGNAFFLQSDLLGQSGERAEAFAPLALNLVDWLAGSADLIALRAKRYTDRKLVDRVEERFNEVNEQYKDGKMGAEEAREAIRGADEEQKAERKRSRWINIVLPCLVILLVGAVVWVVRAANRAGTPRIPPAEPPASLAAEGTDS